VEDIEDVIRIHPAGGVQGLLECKRVDLLCRSLQLVRHRKLNVSLELSLL
jgi:hypothetical protein